MHRHDAETTSGQTASELLVILLHGVGSSAHDLSGLAAVWSKALPDAKVVALDGPHPFDMGGAGRQWFSVRGVTEENRPSRVAAALPALRERVHAEAHRTGIGLDRIVLVGFSQGAIMALQYLLAHPDACAGIIAMAGRLATPVPVAGPARPPVLLLHGAEDRVIPAVHCETADAHLQGLNFPVEKRILSGVGHTITSAMAEQGLRFLRGAAARGRA